MNEQPVIIVGGGVTGLSAAWELQQRGVPYVLLEAGASLGGKIQTVHTGDGFLVERAADAFILGKPHAMQLAREVGLEPEIIHPRPDTKRLYFLKGGQLLDFPRDLKMFIPMDDDAFRESGVLSPEGTERFLAEVNVPPRAPSDDDESLAAFMTRRFGPEALNFIVPMAAGIYVADPNELSMKATFPQFLKMEQEYGSLIRGSRATPRASGPVFASFKGGMGTLTGALAAQLTGDVRLNTSVTHVHPDGVDLAGGARLTGRAVIVTVPAWAAAPLFAGHFPDTSRLIGALKTNGSVAVTLAYRADQVPFDLKTHGLLVDPTEGLPMTAVTVHSSKLAGRAPEAHVLMRVFFKATEPAEALRLAREQVKRLFGVQGEPLHHHLADWRGQNPAYQVGHLEHVARIRASLPGHVRVVGASFTGVGIPDCVNAGRTAAQGVLRDSGAGMAEARE